MSGTTCICTYDFVAARKSSKIILINNNFDMYVCVHNLYTCIYDSVVLCWIYDNNGVSLSSIHG